MSWMSRPASIVALPAARGNRAGEPGVSRGTGPAGCDVTGPARGLYLTLSSRSS
jgi:hypothetical protein